MDVGQPIEFDGTWEGAVAFRPLEPGKFSGDIDAASDLVDVVPGGPAEG